MRDLSIYIHIPFCVRKCLYCDFLSFAAPVSEMESYVNYLLREIREQSVFYRDHRVISIFLGGGTPSLLSADKTESILKEIREAYRMAEDVEITLECNPGTVSPEKLNNYITSGINRLSIGLQSTDDRELASIGRIHDYETFLETYRAARMAGFRNINIDLMAALPGQSIASYQKTLERVTDLVPEHISAYSLILEEGTPLYEKQGEYSFPTEDEDREMYLLTGRYLGERGYRRYEISNYAKDGCACRHNQVYWQCGDYVGFGLGAASMVCGVRWSVPENLEAYRAYVDSMPWMKRGSRPYSSFPKAHALTRGEQMEEFMFLGLRMMRGVDRQAFSDKFGQRVEEVYGTVIDKFRAQGLLIEEEGRIRLTAGGIDVSNIVMAEFLLD